VKGAQQQGGHDAHAGALDVVVGLGSNLGARERLLFDAVQGLAALPGAARVACSSLYASAPLGPPQPDYLNAAMRLRWSGTLPALLAGLLELERAAGRQRRERWGPRTLDLDVLWASTPCDTPALRVPHPELERRWFALQPLLEVAPELGGRYAPALAALGGPRPAVAPAVGPAPTWHGFADPG
jgi:2-amino-4-hydroxy-6-hydroxymethyldihydropteridine diphosphokinase